jgi:molybdate transport system regulatory protein
MRAMTKPLAAPVVRIRIDLGANSIGPGKVALLEQIDTAGSLSEAARQLEMSYRRAWLLLDDLNHAFAERVTIASVGGSGGGGVQLTDFGRALVAAYREIERDAEQTSRARLGWLATQQKKAGARSAGARRPLTRVATTPKRRLNKPGHAAKRP